MVYCQKCGMKNADGARFCNGCGTTLTGHPMDYRKKGKPDECDECDSSTKEGSFFWGIIVLLIALGVIFYGLQQIPGMPDWLPEGERFCWLIFVVIGIAILMGAFRLITGRQSG